VVCEAIDSPRFKPSSRYLLLIGRNYVNFLVLQHAASLVTSLLVVLYWEASNLTTTSSVSYESLSVYEKACLPVRVRMGKLCALYDLFNQSFDCSMHLERKYWNALNSITIFVFFIDLHLILPVSRSILCKLRYFYYCLLSMKFPPTPLHQCAS